MHAADTASEKSIASGERDGPKAEEAKRHAESGQQTVSTPADRATKTASPLSPYPEVDVPGSNGSHKSNTVSTGTQTDPIKPAKGSEKADGAASWNQPGTTQTGWDDADPASKPGILGVHQASCLQMPFFPWCTHTHFCWQLAKVCGHSSGQPIRPLSIPLLIAMETDT